MKVVLVPVGSAGDVHPYVGVGLALKARGHDVSVVTSPYFAPLIERVGLRLVPLGTVEHYEAVTANPDLWSQIRGLQVIAEAIAQATHELYRAVEAECRARPALVVAAGLAFGARIAHETLGLPLVTMHLQPSCFHSLHESPVMTSWLWSINRLPRSLKRGLFWLLDLAADRVLAPGANGLRRELGLPRVGQITSRWWHAPQRVIGLFPDWFAPPQPDWPPQTALTGFPLFDEGGVGPVSQEIGRYLDAVDPPVVFVAGSGNRQAARFFSAAVEVCRRLGCRGMLLTRYAEQCPQRLPPGVRHFDYAPLSHVLPRAAALVHHGGIGTAAQGLASGRPQLVMPMTFDQPDNASRLVRLGVARVVWPEQFDGPTVARAVKALTGHPDVARRCERVAARLRGTDPLTRTCELIEEAGVTLPA